MTLPLLYSTRLATEHEYNDVVTWYSCSQDEVPVYSDDHSVDTVGHIVVKFSASDESNVDTRWSAEHNCYIYRLPYALLWSMHEGLLVFKVLVNGEDRGRAEITFT